MHRSLFAGNNLCRRNQRVKWRYSDNRVESRGLVHCASGYPSPEEHQWGCPLEPLKPQEDELWAFPPLCRMGAVNSLHQDKKGSSARKLSSARIKPQYCNTDDREPRWLHLQTALPSTRAQSPRLLPLLDIAGDSFSHLQLEPDTSHWVLCYSCCLSVSYPAHMENLHVTFPHLLTKMKGWVVDGWMDGINDWSSSISIIQHPFQVSIFQLIH